MKLRPKVLKECQDAVVKTYGEAARFYLVIHEALDYGVVKMNVDTDMQYAFTRAVAGQMFKNDERRAESGRRSRQKKAYDPRSYLALVFRFCAGSFAVFLIQIGKIG